MDLDHEIEHRRTMNYELQIDVLEREVKELRERIMRMDKP
jgi:hypothetical protein